MLTIHLGGKLIGTVYTLSDNMREVLTVMGYEIAAESICPTCGQVLSPKTHHSIH